MKNLDSVQSLSLHCHLHRDHQDYERLYRLVGAIATMKVSKPANFILRTSFLTVSSMNGRRVRCHCDAM